MNQQPTRIYASVGLAGQMGCLIGIFAIGSLLIGLWLERTFQTGRWVILICVGASLPISLIVTLLIVRRMSQRLLRPNASEKPSDGETSPGSAGQDSANHEAN